MPVAILTGASQGIGVALAETLSELGYSLVLTARNTEKLNALAARLSTPTTVVPGDITQAAHCQAVIDAALSAYGRIDVLINNAGIAGKIALLSEIPITEIEQTIATNLTAPLLLMRAVLPTMVAQNEGAIININSVAGRWAYPYWSVYCASKFGLAAATEAVGEEQRSNNIRVIGIHPGAVDTPIWNAIEANPNRAEMLHPQDVANAVRYALTQPPQAWVSEIVIKPQHSVL
jgi:NADP-dependent 3-hydroxy acid dehydrogenase YdfG